MAFCFKCIPRSMKKSWVGEGPAPSGCLIRLMLCTKCAKAAVCPWQFRCAPSHAVCIQLGTDTWPGDGLGLDFHSSPWGRLQRKISRCTCAQTHAHAVERIVPTTLIIIKHQTSFLSYRNFKLMFICLVLIFTVSWKTTDTDTLTGIIAWKLSVVLILLQHVNSLRKKVSEKLWAKVLFPQKTSPRASRAKTGYGLSGSRKRFCGKHWLEYKIALQCLKDKKITKERKTTIKLGPCTPTSKNHDL